MPKSATMRAHPSLYGWPPLHLHLRITDQVELCGQHNSRRNQAFGRPVLVRALAS